MTAFKSPKSPRAQKKARGLFGLWKKGSGRAGFGLGPRPDHIPIAKTLAKEPKKASENVKGNRTLKQVTVRVEVNDKEGEDEKVKENANELNATNDKLDDIIENKTGDGIIDSFISNTKVAN